jgi:HAD superfamily hydrolase (TIGR01509 family)
MNKIKAVIFDHGGTLAESGMQWDVYKIATKNLLSRHGYQRKTQQIYDAMMEAINYRLEIRKELGIELNPEEFFTRIINLMEIPKSDPIIIDLIADFYNYYTSVYLDCLPQVLADLSRSYKVALLSNSWIDGPRISLEKQGYSKWFDLMVCSCDIGIPKPDSKIFHYVLRKLGVQANEAVMVGDDIEADMKGAAAVGIIPIWIENIGSERWEGYSIKSVCELPSTLDEIQKSS